MADRVWIEAGPEFHRVAMALGEIDDTMPGKFRRELRKTATPIIRDVRMAALSLPARGVKHTGLRARIAKGVGVRVGVGMNASMRITTSMTNPQEAALPRGEDNGPLGWRHPVYGHQNVWVHQRGGSWFKETISEDQDLIQRKLTDVLEESRDFVARQG